MTLTSVAAMADEPFEVQDAFQMQVNKYPNQITDTYHWYFVDLNGDDYPEVLIDSNNNGTFQIWEPAGMGNATFGGVIKQAAIEFYLGNNDVEYSEGNAINPAIN